MRGAQSAAQLIRPRVDFVMHLAARLDPPIDAPCTAIELDRDERMFLVELLRRSVNEAMKQRRRGVNHQRDLDIAFFVHTHGRGGAKAASLIWKGVTASNAAKIASENKKQFTELRKKAGIKAIRDDVARKVLQLTRS